ncbi:MAG: hypothetical protein ACJAWS_003257 [Oleiphilaceae bacterium]|jgi:hypothetical protein
MFSIFKPNPRKKLEKLYKQKLELAMIAQRNGDIRSYSTITSEAQDIWEEIKKFDAKKQ